MKCRGSHLRDRFKNGGIDFRATFANFEDEHAWITNHDARGRFEIILSRNHASQAGAS